MKNTDIPDFSTLVLSKQQLEDLKYLAQQNVEGTPDWTNRTIELCKLGLVIQNPDLSKGIGPGCVYSITERGRQYLRYLKRRKSEMWFANTMSVLAFIVSVIALIVSIVSQ